MKHAYIYNFPQALEMIENQNYRLERPSKKCPEAVYQLMLSCWSLEAADRPSFEQLHKAFQEDPEYRDIASHSALYQNPGDL